MGLWLGVFKQHWAALSLFATGHCILCTLVLSRYRLERNPPVWGSRGSLCDGPCLRRPGYGPQPPLGRFSCHLRVRDKQHTFRGSRATPRRQLRICSVGFLEPQVKSVHAHSTGEDESSSHNGSHLQQPFLSVLPAPFSGREESDAPSLEPRSGCSWSLTQYQQCGRGCEGRAVQGQCRAST